MEEFKAKSHAVKKMTRKGLVETDSREGIVKETAEAKSDGRRINEADFQLERKGAQSRADPVDDKPVSDAASRRKKQMVQPIKSARETSSTTAQQPAFGKVLKLD